jgi:hypothetical protein
LRGACGASDATSGWETTTEDSNVGAVAAATRAESVVALVVESEAAGSTGPVVSPSGSASGFGVSGVPVGWSVPLVCVIVGDCVVDVVGVVGVTVPVVGVLGVVVVLGAVVGDVDGVAVTEVDGVGEVVGVGVSTGVVGVAPGVVMTVVTCSTTLAVATSATCVLVVLAATVTRASTTEAEPVVTTPAVASVDDTAAGTVAARAGVRLLRKTWVVTALTSAGLALPALAAVAALRASVAAEETAERTARSTAGVSDACTDSSCCGRITVDSEELTALTTIWRAELASSSERSPTATTSGGGVTGRPGTTGETIGPDGAVEREVAELALPDGRCSTPEPLVAPRVVDVPTVNADPGDLLSDDAPSV